MAENKIKAVIQTEEGPKTLTFPMGTAQSVIQRTVKQFIQQDKQRISETSAANPQGDFPVPDYRSGWEKTKDVAGSMWTPETAKAIGATIGTGITLPSAAVTGPAGPITGSVLGAMAGQNIYDITKGTPSGETAKNVLKAGTTDAMFSMGGASVGPLLRVTKNAVLSKMLGIGDDKATEWLVRAGRQNIPTGIVDISDRPLTRGFRSVLGIIPILGGPIKKAQTERAAALTNRLNQVLDDIAPIATANKMGLDVAEGAKNTTLELKRWYKSLYNEADQLAEGAGEIVPTAGLKGILKAARDKQGRPSLVKQTEVPQGPGIIDPSTGKEFPRDPVMRTQKVAMQGPQSNEVDAFISQFDDLPEFITVKQLRAIQKDITRLGDSAKGFDQRIVGDARIATETALTDLNLTDVPEEIAEQIVARYQLANRILFDSIELLSKPVGKQISKGSHGDLVKLLRGSKGQPGSLNNDELMDYAFKARSPEAIRQLRSIVGDEIVQKNARRWIGGAIADATKRTEKGLLRSEGVVIDGEAVAKSLGLTPGKVNKGSIDSLNEMLRGTGVTGNDIQDLVDMLATFDTIVAPAKMIARRMTLGGLRSALRGATGVGAIAAGTQLTLAPAVIGTVLVRQLGKALTSPKTLRELISFGNKYGTKTAFGRMTEPQRRARNAAFTTSAIRLLRLAYSQPSGQEESKPAIKPKSRYYDPFIVKKGRVDNTTYTTQAER